MTDQHLTESLSEFQRGRVAGLTEVLAFLDRQSTEAYGAQLAAQERYSAEAGERAEMRIRWISDLEEHLRHAVENPRYFG